MYYHMFSTIILHDQILPKRRKKKQLALLEYHLSIPERYVCKFVFAFPK